VDPKELLFTAARAVAVYVLMLVVVRALGKRTVGNFSAFDLLVALMLGEGVDEIIYGDVRFIQGSVAIVVIGALAYGDSWLAYSNKRLNSILEGNPSVVVRNGAFEHKGMRAERMNEPEVLAHLRSQGIHDMREVKLAIVEQDGSVSVLKHSWAEAVQKADIDDEARRARAEALDGKDEPPPSKRTDSPKAIGA
jgi:uncharacterized membrane protein YcaP (DUF421 family)